MNRTILFILAIIALTCAPRGPAFAGQDQSSCEFDLTEAVPDLNVIDIAFTASGAQDVKDLGYAQAWIIERIRASVRAPVRIASAGRDPRYVVYLVNPPLSQFALRVAVTWTELNTILVFSVSRQEPSARTAEYTRVEKFAYLRHVNQRFSMTDASIGYLSAYGISLDDLDVALHRAVAQPVHHPEYAGYFWLVGDYGHQRALSIRYLELPGVNQVIAARPAHPEDRSHFITVSGLEHSTPDADLIDVVKGLYGQHLVRFAPGIEQKIANTHQLTRAHVVRAFERARGDVSENRPKEHDGSQERRYFVSPLNSDRYVKVVFIFEPGNQIKVITAFKVRRSDFDEYDRHFRQKLLNRW